MYNTAWSSRLNEATGVNWVVFGEEVKNRRKWIENKMRREDEFAPKFTQSHLAKKIGFQPNSISRIELGTSGTDYATVVALSDALEYAGEERRRFFALAGLVESRNAMAALPPSGLIIGPDGARREDGAELGEPDDDLLKQANAMIAKLTARLAEKNQN